MTLALAQSPSSALSTQHSALSKSGWIDLPEAARRSGKSLGQLRRLAGDQWFAAGLAKQEKNGKTKATWVVHETADPDLARVKMPDQIGRDLRHLTLAQRDVCLLREQILELWEESCKAAGRLGFTRAAGTGKFLQSLLLGQEIPKQSIELSERTLQLWYQRYRQEGLIGLADGRSTPAQTDDDAPSDDPFFALVRSLYLTQRRLKLTLCHGYSSIEAERRGWQVRSYKACQRMIGKLDRKQVIKLREGESAYVEKCEGSIERDYTQLDSNSLWCSDHHRLDLLCAVPQADGKTKHLRPWLSGWMDYRSRKIVGWSIVLTYPNSDLILQTFVAGAVGHGLPSVVQMDNGEDYDCRALQGRTKKERRKRVEPNPMLGVFPQLKVEVKHAQPYHGQSKTIERLFGSVADRFARLFETYCGNTTDNRPEDLPDQLAAGKAPTLDEVRRAFGEWLLVDYHHRPHFGNGMEGGKPAEVWEAHLVRKRVMSEEELLFTCLPTVGPVKVRKQGVAWKGIRYGAFDTKLQKFWGKKVYLKIIPADATRILALDLEGRLIGMVKSNVKISPLADQQTVREAMGEKRRMRKLHADQKKMRPYRSLDVQQIVADKAAQKLLENHPGTPPAIGGDQPPPTVIVPVQTIFDGQLDEIREAFELPSKNPLRLPGADAAPAEPARFTYQPASLEEEEDPAPTPSMRELMANRKRDESEDVT